LQAVFNDTDNNNNNNNKDDNYDNDDDDDDDDDDVGDKKRKKGGRGKKFKLDSYFNILTDERWEEYTNTQYGHTFLDEPNRLLKFLEEITTNIKAKIEPLFFSPRQDLINEVIVGETKTLPAKLINQFARQEGGNNTHKSKKQTIRTIEKRNRKTHKKSISKKYIK
jgi:hypothetical protein